MKIIKFIFINMTVSLFIWGLGVSPVANARDFDFSGQLLYHSAKAKIEFDYPPVFTTSEMAADEIGHGVIRINLHLPCSLNSRFSIEAHSGKTIDQIISKRFFNDDNGRTTFNTWISQQGLNSKDITVGSKPAYQVHVSQSQQTIVVADGILISYDDPQGCTSDPMITDVFERIVASIRFLHDE